MGCDVHDTPDENMRRGKLAVFIRVWPLQLGSSPSYAAKWLFLGNCSTVDLKPATVGGLRKLHVSI